MNQGEHPGFHDSQYRSRRDAIAATAHIYVPGDNIPQVTYSDEENILWSHLLDQLAASHEKHACSRFLAAKERMMLSQHQIPQLSDIAEQLGNLTGYGIEPVPDLVSPGRFLEALSRQKLLSTQYIRHRSAREYTPEPDLVHEIIGHSLLLSDPEYAPMNTLFGKVASLLPDDENKKLISLYWHTIEFGVCLENGEVRAYGAGLLSSIGEMGTIDSVPKRPFNIVEMQNTEYDTEHVQPYLFCAESFDTAITLLTDFLTLKLEKLINELP